MEERHLARRDVLLLGGTALTVGLAGCSDNSTGNGQSSNPADGTETSTDPPTSGTATATETQSSVTTPAKPLTKAARVLPGDGDTRDRFGQAVALTDDGTTALVGAYGHAVDGAYQSGAAYVFERSNGSWSKQTKLVPEDGDKEDRFGWAVAIAGSTALVTAPNDEPNFSKSGSAYVFERSNGTWTQQTKVVPEQGDMDNQFGWSADLSQEGKTALVGGKGGVYTFERSGDTWNQQAKLARTGWRVALSGDGGTVLVGNLFGGDRDAGSVTVHERSDGGWTKRTALTTDDSDPKDNFGSSLALSDDGTTALVGARAEQKPNGKKSGAAYIFERSGGTWSLTAKLAASDGGKKDKFGHAVSLSASGSVALVGLRTGVGAGYVFDGFGGKWTQRAKLDPAKANTRERVGAAVALAGSGDAALLGAPRAPNDTDDNPGAAYIFER